RARWARAWSAAAPSTSTSAAGRSVAPPTQSRARPRPWAPPSAPSSSVASMAGRRCSVTKLPDAVKAMVADEPLVEDVVLDILREKIPQIFWADETEQSVPPPFGIVRRDTYIGTSEKDHRFISRAYCAIHTFTEGVD